MPVDLVAERSQVVVFLTLHVLGGNIGMLLILFTILISGKVLRHTIFLNFCTTCFIFSGSYALLFYAGQIDRLVPSFGLCVTQEAMIYASAAMIGISVFVFNLHLFLVIREAIYPNPAPKWRKLRVNVMLAAPYLVYLVVFLIAFVSGNIHPELVHRSSLYCTIKMKSVTALGSGIAGIATITSIIVETSTVVMLMRHWHVIRDAKTTLSLAYRTAILSVSGVFGILTCLAFLADSKSHVANIVLACFPMAAFLVFGSQSDILRVWCFWKKDPDRKGEAASDTADSQSSV